MQDPLRASCASAAAEAAAWRRTRCVVGLLGQCVCGCGFCCRYVGQIGPILRRLFIALLINCHADEDVADDNDDKGSMAASGHDSHRDESHIQEAEVRRHIA